MKIKQLMSFSVVALTAGLVNAGAMSDRGKEIFESGDDRDSGFISADWTQELILTNALGKESRRLMRIIALEGNDVEGDKTLIVFREPKDSRGVSLLTHGIKEDDDNQWMYLPNLKRVKRISAGAKTSRFVGSEFTFEDLAIREVGDFSYKFIKDTELNGVAVHEIEVIPLDPKSGYSRQIAWIDQKELIVHKLEYYDKKSKLQKTLFFEDYHQYLGKHWRAHTTRMVNHQTNKKSRLIVSGNYEFKTGVTKKDFSKNKLRSIR